MHIRLSRVLALFALMIPAWGIGYYAGAANAQATTIAVYPPVECSQEEVLETPSI